MTDSLNDSTDHDTAGGNPSAVGASAASAERARDSGQAQLQEVDKAGKDGAKEAIDGGQETRFLTRAASLDFPASLDSSAWARNQQAALVWYATPPDRRLPSTAKALAERLGVDEATIHRWRKADGWDEAVQEIAKLHLVRHRPNIYGALIRQAEAGDIKAIRLYHELIGDIGPEGKAGATNVAVQLVIAQDSSADVDGGAGRRLTVVDGMGGEQGKEKGDEHE